MALGTPQLPWKGPSAHSLTLTSTISEGLQQIKEIQISLLIFWKKKVNEEKPALSQRDKMHLQPQHTSPEPH